MPVAGFLPKGLSDQPEQCAYLDPSLLPLLLGIAPTCAAVVTAAGICGIALLCSSGCCVALG